MVRETSPPFPYMSTLHSHHGISGLCVLTSGVTWAQWAWERKIGDVFEVIRLGRHLPLSPLLERVIFFGFLSGHNPELGSIGSCPWRLATSMLKLGTGQQWHTARGRPLWAEVMMPQGDERTVMSHLIGCFESWTSRCWESPGEA